MSDAQATLATRLAAVQNRSTLRITTRGRRSGRRHTVTIWFVVEGSTMYLATANADRDWVKNLTKTPEVELDMDGLRLRGHGTCVPDGADTAHVADLLARKYWLAWIGSWLGLGADRSFRVDDLEVTT